MYQADVASERQKTFAAPILQAHFLSTNSQQVCLLNVQYHAVEMTADTLSNKSNRHSAIIRYKFTNFFNGFCIHPLLAHRWHGTGCRRSWNCCDQRTRSVVMWKHFCLILFTGTRIRIDSVMRARSSSRRCNISALVTVTQYTEATVMYPSQTYIQW